MPDSVHPLRQLLATNALVMTLDCCRFLALALSSGLLIELASAQFSDDPCLFDRALEAPQSDIEGLVFLDPDVWHKTRYLLVTYSLPTTRMTT